MGVLPLVFLPDESPESLGLDGSETYRIDGVRDIEPRSRLTVRAVKPDGRQIDFQVTARLDTVVEVDYYQHGGILPYVLRKILSGG